MPPGLPSTNVEPTGGPPTCRNELEPEPEQSARSNGAACGTRGQCASTAVPRKRARIGPTAAPARLRITLHDATQNGDADNTVNDPSPVAPAPSEPPQQCRCSMWTRCEPNDPWGMHWRCAGCGAPVSDAERKYRELYHISTHRLFLGTATAPAHPAHNSLMLRQG